MTSVHRICWFRKWGLCRTDPIPDRKWGRSQADPVLLCFLIGRTIQINTEDSTLKRATCAPKSSLCVSISFRNEKLSIWTTPLQSGPTALARVFGYGVLRGKRVGYFCVRVPPTHRSQGNLRGGGLSSRVWCACVGPLWRPTWREVVARWRQGPSTAPPGGARSGQSLCHSDWGALRAA